ncbi:YgaP family membrane protein [Ferruginibacter sp. SUN002]|uniref:YgaP family membrane protein n=1 Tax=Ferruginibacter sp. SUN002 TaxID=2937789 RepID=UPI003D36D2BC
MQCNVGKSDKTIRLLLAIIVGLAGLYFRTWWALAALVPLVTGLVSFCPLYKILGINTCNSEKV